VRRQTDIAIAPRRFRREPRAEVRGRRVPVALSRRARLLGLDLVFLDLELHQIAVRRGVPSGRIAFERRAKAVLELPAGEPRPPEGA
jgi:hypothetical protein